MKLKDLIVSHRKGIIVVLILVVIENVAWLMEPKVFGNLIDAFINKYNNKSVILTAAELTPLLIWIIIYAANSLAGASRRLAEPHVFQKMLTAIASHLSESGKSTGIPPTKLAARAQLSQEIVYFCQYRIPELTEHIIAVVGALIALTLFDWRISTLCLLVTIPLSIIGRIYNNKVSVYQRDLHDKYENIYDTFSGMEPENVKQLYMQMGKQQKKIAFWSALNFGSLRLVLLIIFMMVLYISIDLDDFTTGNIFSIVTYLWAFISSVEYIPDLMESRTSLSDIIRRFKTEED
ncbi:MAG: ABC transporter six-transmembrane domain-containing protein [Ignavibacteria bacterium]|nr:ABC transporter six-transmembrane domain-containing protein [Ignavibacteria bacterium]